MKKENYRLDEFEAVCKMYAQDKEERESKNFIYFLARCIL